MSKSRISGGARTPQRGFARLFNPRALGLRALELGKPILTWKAGNSAVGRAAAESHTASMTADYELYRAVFREGGFIEVRDVHEVVDITRVSLCAADHTDHIAEIDINPLFVNTTGVVAADALIVLKN